MEKVLFSKDVSSDCTLCRKKFDWDEPIIWKLPENLWFCLPCTEKFKDDTAYKWVDAWLTLEYRPWIILDYIENENKITQK